MGRYSLRRCAWVTLMSWNMESRSLQVVCLQKRSNDESRGTNSSLERSADFVVLVGCCGDQLSAAHDSRLGKHTSCHLSLFTCFDRLYPSTGAMYGARTVQDHSMESSHDVEVCGQSTATRSRSMGDCLRRAPGSDRPGVPKIVQTDWPFVRQSVAVATVSLSQQVSDSTKAYDVHDSNASGTVHMNSVSLTLVMPLKLNSLGRKRLSAGSRHRSPSYPQSVESIPTKLIDAV